MKRGRYAVLLVLLVAAFTLPAAAHDGDHEHVDTVILASTANYPDALVSAAAAGKIGVPILLTEKDTLPQQTSDALNRFSPSEVVLVGGTSVISEQVETQLSASYNTTRLWGTTRYGTAAQVAERFWIEGSDDAVLVQNSFQDQNGRVLAAAKEIARDRETPIYLTPDGKVPAAVQNSLQSLGVQEVTVVGPAIPDSYRTALNEIGVTVEEEITAPTEDAVEDEIEQRREDDINASTRMMVVASSRYHHTIAAANPAGFHLVHVTGEAELDRLVSVVNENGVTAVKVVGQPQLAQTTADRLRSDTDATVRLQVAQADETVRMNANVSEEARERFAKRYEKKIAAWEERRQRMRAHMVDRVNQTIQRAENLVDENASQEARDALQEARILFSAGEYEKAWEHAHEAASMVRGERFEQMRDDPQKIQEEIDEETADLQEKVDDLRALNREFAEEMDENMTVEERLDTIEEFRHERQAAIEELMTEARTMEGDIRDRLRHAREEIRSRSGGERFRFRAECTEDSADSLPAVTQHRVSGHDGRVETQGRILIPVPTYEASPSWSDTGQQELTVTINLQRMDRELTGIQCVGVAEFKHAVDVAAGNWTVQLTVNVDGEEVLSTTETVEVGQDPEEGEAAALRCHQEISEAQAAAEGKICTQQFQRLTCPHEDDVVYGAANGCEIGYLKEQGWTAGTNDTDHDHVDPVVRAEDQPVYQGTVSVAGLLDQPGYVVVHRSEDGTPGTVVGHSELLENTFSATVPINTSYGTGDYFAMLHYDDGDGTYEFPGDDHPTTHGDEIVQKQFYVEMSETTETSLPTEYRFETTDGDGCDTSSFFYDGDAVDMVQMPAGEEVTVTFAPRTNCTYSGGAEFYSNPDTVFGESAVIQGGETTTVSFVVPSDDFAIEQWWPDEAVMKATLMVDAVQ